MTTPDRDPAQGASGEPVFERLELESRAPELLLPKDVFWPAKVQDGRLHDVIESMLPQVVEVLSQPISPASPEQVDAIFADHSSDGSTPWGKNQNTDGSYEFCARPYAVPIGNGETRSYHGVRYVFDQTGRLTRVSRFSEIGPDSEVELFRSEFLYDERGYLTRNSIWDRAKTQVTEAITYGPDNNTGGDGQIPDTLTHTVTLPMPDGTRVESLPMAVDLRNYADWIYRNPYGYHSVLKSELESSPAQPAEVTVHEERNSILFANPDELEQTLIAFATDIGYRGEFNDRHLLLAKDGVYETNLDESRERLATALVADSMINKIREVWTAIQTAQDQGALWRDIFDFGWSAVGNLKGLSGGIIVTKRGLQLGVYDVDSSNPREHYIASICGKERQLQSITLELPINATAEESCFLIDIQAIVSRLALPMDHDAVNGFINYYLIHRPDADHPKNVQSQLWKDEESGVEVSLLTERADYDTGENIDRYFGHDATSIWGPKPKHLSRRSDTPDYPKLRIAIHQPTTYGADPSTVTQFMYDTAQMFRSRLAT